MGGVEYQGISKEGQTVLSRLMESLIWQLPAGFMALRGKGSERDNGLCSPQFLTVQPLSVCCSCPSSCHPSAGAQRSESE